MKHGWRRNKAKLNICLFGLLAVLTLAGFGYSATLMNVNEPFIDLKAGTKMAVSDAKQAQAQSKPQQTPRPQPVVSTQIEVRVSGSTFTVDGKTMLRLSDLTAVLKEDSSKGKSVVLIDDYANYKMYRSVEKRIRDAGFTPVKKEEK